ncbi:nitroreductase family protein [Mycetocola reblochoni]|uniref:Nitroreductase n=2 Tax=Mycetocola reblochoni TaxID=331618 RepID=A0A1R4IP15_9MICO|nr:nitroreductase family protein [Mycetocola reblochoni]RLP67886.1 nitroreductase [Mycetocola reblochoni]SJN21459.1 Nitroreductase [Mycetocola reblochoni REB411]
MSSTSTVDRTAPTAHEILPVLAERWSPRALDGDRVIDEDSLSAALEAARWSPSAFNIQPWRFIVGRRGTATFDTIFGTLAEFNQGWAANAGALVLTIAQVVDDNGRPNPTASYDLGQAVAHLSIQAHAGGLVVHQMTGFDAAAAANSFGLPDSLVPVSVVALGHLGEADQLNDQLREREVAPRVRRPLADTIIVSE